MCPRAEKRNSPANRHRPTKRIRLAVMLIDSAYRGGTGFAPLGWHPNWHKTLDESKRGSSHLAPAVIDDKRMSPVGHRYNLGHALVVLLILVGGVRDRRWHRVVLVAGDDQQGSAVGAPGINLRLSPGVEVFGGRLKERCAGGRYGEGLVELLRLIFADDVGKGVAKLLVGQRDRAVAVGRIAKHRRCRLQR